jgi:hypothetical protein
MTMKRVIAILGLVLTAGAGAFAQNLLTQEGPSNEPLQLGVIYTASFCSTPTIPTVGNVGTFHLRATKLLNRGWIDVEYGFYPQVFDVTEEPNPSLLTARMNSNLLCYLKPLPQQ